VETNQNISQNLNPYTSKNSTSQIISSYHKSNHSNAATNMNYSRKYTKEDVNMKMTASQYMNDDEWMKDCFKGKSL